MDFTLDDEQIALREGLRSLLARRYGDFEERRRSVGSDLGHDPTLWKALAEMGALGLPFAEDDGGMGAGPVEVGLVAQELGRVLAPEPYLAAVVLAGGVVAALGTDVQRAEVLGELSSGNLHLALAHAEPGRRWSSTASSVTATLVGDEWRISGVKEPVLHGDADTLVVTAALPDGGTGAFLVAGETATTTTATAYDGTRVSRVVLDGALGVPLGTPGADATDGIAVALDRARITACHEALGAMEAALEATTGYLRSRKQFGVPLSTFQSLTFRAADMYVAVELSTSMVWWATMVAAERDATATREAAARAALQVSRAGRLVGQEAIQLHGGIGMTAEYLVGNLTAHLTALDHLLGDGSHHLRSLAQGVAAYDALDPLA